MSAIDPIDSLSSTNRRMSALQMYQDSLYANSQPAPAANAISPMLLMMVQQLFMSLLQQLLQQGQQSSQGGGGNSPTGGGGGGGGPAGGGPGPSMQQPASSPFTRDFGTRPSPAHDHFRPANPAPEKTQTPEVQHHKPDHTKPSHTTQPPASAPASSPDNKVDSSTPVTASSRPGAVLPVHKGEVEVNKPIIVGPGETFDGKNQLFRAGAGLNGGGTAETQDPMFIVAPGGTIKNVQFDGRNGNKLYGDGIHLMGDAKVDNVHAVHGGPDDMITIDGPGNRARDAQLAGLAQSSIPSGPANVEITNSSFRHSHDKAIQLNGDATVKLKGIYADDVGQLLVTMGGKPITAHVSIEDSTLNGVRSHVFRVDSRNSTIDLKNVETDTGRIQVMAGDPSKVRGATTVMPSTDPA